MKAYIWNRLNNTSLKEKTKQILFLILNVILCSVVGAAAWLVLGHIFLSNITGLIEFIGYAAFFWRNIWRIDIFIQAVNLHRDVYFTYVLHNVGFGFYKAFVKCICK